MATGGSDENQNHAPARPGAGVPGDIADKPALRRALGAFATGVTIVTTLAPGTAEPVGFTANSFTSVSLDPPLLLVCLAHTAASYNAFRDAESFAVNVLAADQEETARRFATRGADKFGQTRWQSGLRGAPLIEGCLARFDCAMHQRVEAGDHDILMGRVIGFSRQQGQALLYHGGAFQRLG
jgi:flavin reductase (DIM6/NTAB) family NADH-FMN oxidoreductase RutF